jgi:hypothetical protein
MSSFHLNNGMMASQTTTPSQRLDEIASILAGAILRLRAKHAAGDKEREFFRDSHLEVPPKIGPDCDRPN